MKRMALVFGVFFILTGAGAFVPALDPGGLLFGLFAMNQAHGLLHIASGVLGLLMALGTEGFARRYFRIVGLVFGVLTLMGFLAGNHDMLLGMAMNKADNVLDVVIAAAALALGFLWPVPDGDEERAHA